MDDKDKLSEQFMQLWSKNPIFRNNVAFLTQVPLNHAFIQVINECIDRMEDFYRYDLSQENHATTTPPLFLHILNVEDTLDLLLNNHKSFCRLADGEFSIIRGESMAFQEYDPKLAERLSGILQSYDDKCYVGLDSRYFHSTSNLLDKEKKFVRSQGRIMREVMEKFCNRKKLYIEASITCFYLHSPKNYSILEYTVHYEKIKQLFKNKKLAIFSGRTVFDNIKFNVFEYATERRHIFTESKNAWRCYNEIISAAMQIPKDFTLCFILGPTATVLAYDLAQKGYTAWDIGHIAKDYDLFMKNRGKDSQDALKFFDPD